LSELVWTFFGLFGFVAKCFSYYSGGPAGLIYGFIFVWAGILCVYMTLGELASMIPTSGGQYHWVSILAPESVKKPLSYITGKVNRAP